MKRAATIALLVTTLMLAACSAGSSAPSAATGPAPSVAVSGSGDGASPPITAAPTASGSAIPTVTGGPGSSLPDFPSASVAPPSPGSQTPAETSKFISAVFADAQADWRTVFSAARLAYTPAQLRLFTAAVHTACGAESSEVGPFYCPADHTVYLDVTFFTQLETQFGVSGDFAQAYVVAHELGHHIQTITGVTGQVAAASQASPAAANTLSILSELQADCYAGVWAHSTYRRGLLEPGDIDEALTAAAAVGDDFLQHATTGTIEPEKWTHGSSAQRQQWLTTGYDSGKPSDCNTFAQ